MRAQPGWDALETIAQTLASKHELVAGAIVPRELAVAVPALVLAIGVTRQSIRQTAKATVDALPTAEPPDGRSPDARRTPDALAALLLELSGA
jgi:hypothetical protein